MPTLTHAMDHDAAVAHLRQEVTHTARSEIGRLVLAGEPAFFGAVRGVMSDLDYVAALYYGWESARRDRIATKSKTVKFIRQVMHDALPAEGYDRWGQHLYELYRTGVVHLRAPKILGNPSNHPPKLGWLLMQQRSERVELEAESHPTSVRHLTAEHRKGNDTLLLPLSIEALLEDYLAAVELFARRLEAESGGGGSEMISRWRQTADALCEPDDSDLRW